MFPPTVVCRPALPIDTPGVMELTREIWGGHDYVPQVWDEWLADPQGLLAVAEYGGRVAGLGKLTRLGDQDWWLEGLRTHPALQGQGIASRVHDYILETWQRRCGGVIRLATNSQRIPVHHLCERTGFTRINEVSLFTTPALPGEAEAFLPLSPEESQAALELINQSPSLAWSSGLIDLGWKWASPSEAHLQAAIARQSAYWWREEDGHRPGLLVLRVDEEENLPFIMLLACAPDQASALLAAARSLAGHLGYAQCAWQAPLHPALLPALAEAGYTRQWDDSLFLFEKRILESHKVAGSNRRSPTSSSGMV